MRKAVVSTAAASYFQMATVVLTGLISFPLALRYLSNEQVGLWSFTVQSLGYFLLLDFGVTSSAGRLMGEPVYSGSEEECSRWFSLFMVVLTIQGLLILLPGILLVDPLLNWFSIPPHLRTEARALWLLMLALNALVFPFRVSGGILVAQNRYYWSTLGS